MKAKKLLALGLAGTMAAMCFAGCGSSASSSAPASSAGSAAQQGSGETNWPERGISLVVPFAAGGDTDYYARLYAKYLEEELGQTVTVVNTEGSGGTVGAQTVADAEPDGYTILFYHTGNLYANKMLGVSELDQNSF